MTPRLLIGALLLATAACSSGGDVASSSTDTPEATASPTTAATTGASTPATTAPATTESPATAASTTVPPPTTSASDATTSPPSDLTDAELADQELARTALISLDTFPDGWVEAPDDGDDSDVDDEFENQFDACLGRDDAVRIGDDLDELAVSTGDFQPAGDDVTSVSHEIVLAPDADTAIAAMSEVAVDGAESCIADVIRDFYEVTLADDPSLDGITIGEVIVTRTERERPTDVALGVLLEIPLMLDGDTASQFLEVLYQREGRALSELSFTSFGAPFSRDGYTILSNEAAVGIAAIGN